MKPSDQENFANGESQKDELVSNVREDARTKGKSKAKMKSTRPASKAKVKRQKESDQQFYKRMLR